MGQLYLDHVQGYEKQWRGEGKEDLARYRNQLVGIPVLGSILGISRRCRWDKRCVLGIGSLQALVVVLVRSAAHHAAPGAC
ncbi:hypothetical protein C8K38_11632 [Rhodococcus sp. OK611]|nr:hypothetical protein C8K38_11632 [Rhodococcus sp. OK611]SNX92770.1 hypothetical protein SAMN05447004_11632 [Rhodococcus sp. OK270]